MTVLDILRTMVAVQTTILVALTMFAAIYWVYAQRRIRYLEEKLWLRRVEGGS